MKFLPDDKQPKPYYTCVHKYVGEIDLNEGLVDVSDPCYDRSTVCAKFDIKIKSGKYKCYINTANFPHKGRCEEDDSEVVSGKKKVNQLVTHNDKRIVTLIIEHENIKHSPKVNEDAWECISQDIGVDAGMCGFYHNKPDFDDDNSWTDFWQNAKHLPGNRWLTCDVKPYGVTVSSGFGDGVYPLYQYKENGEVVALKVEFA